MKTPRPNRASGFTLVELLVVIAIIAVLAGAGFSAGNAAIQKAKKMQALAVCTELENGVKMFFTEYGSLPTDEVADTPAASPIESDTTAGLAVLEILLARETGEEDLKNGRGIKFIDIKEGKGNKGGLIYNSSGTTLEALYDPWGGPYNIVFDADYDEVIEVKPKGASVTRTLNGRRVAVWSDGADAVDAGSGKTTDDVTTW